MHTHLYTNIHICRCHYETVLFYTTSGNYFFIATPHPDNCYTDELVTEYRYIQGTYDLMACHSDHDGQYTYMRPADIKVYIEQCFTVIVK